MMLDVLAHQGGWDEAMFVVIPLVVFTALLLIARRRVERLEEQDGSDDADSR